MRRLALPEMALVSVAALPAYGACLLSDYSVSAEFRRSESVLEGTVLSVRPLSTSGDLVRTRYEIAPHHVFKGHPSGLLRIYSENDSGRFPMDIGESYVLFIYRDDGRARVDPCGNSVLVANASKTLTRIKRLVAGNSAN